MTTLLVLAMALIQPKQYTLSLNVTNKTISLIATMYKNDSEGKFCKQKPSSEKTLTRPRQVKNWTSDFHKAALTNSLEF